MGTLGMNLGEKHRMRTRLASLGRKHSKETKDKMKKSHLGKTHSETTKIKLSQLAQGRVTPNDVKERIRNSVLNSPNRIFRDTSIELKVETELQKRGFVYYKQVPLCKIAVVDFYLPEFNAVIQCDGCYWHGCPIHFPERGWDKKVKDFAQDTVLKSNGFLVYRFWEHEIEESVETCISSITAPN